MQSYEVGKRSDVVIWACGGWAGVVICDEDRRTLQGRNEDMYSIPGREMLRLVRRGGLGLDRGREDKRNRGLRS